MFGDPQTVTVNSVAQSLARIKSEGLSSLYQSSDGNYMLLLSHENTKSGRVRTLAKFTQRMVVTDPITSEQDYDTTTVQITIDRPVVGWTAVTLGYLITGITAWINSGGNVLKLYGQES